MQPERRGCEVAGEDASEAHQNDAMWYHDFASGSTTRMLSTPYGSETTSTYFYPNINGYAYIAAVVQHPYGESDEDKVYGTAPCNTLRHCLQLTAPFVVSC
jgi:uncharacterized protein